MNETEPDQAGSNQAGPGPCPGSGADDVGAWRAALLRRMLWWGTGFLGLAWAGGTAAAWVTGLHFLVVANTLAYSVLVALTVLPRISYRVRASGLLGLC